MNYSINDVAVRFKLSVHTIRFYDKKQERINKGYTLDTAIETWQRTEIQIRHDRAMQAVKMMAYDADNLGLFMSGILKRYLKFKIKEF